MRDVTALLSAALVLVALTWHAATKVSAARFTASCNTEPAPRCPPIGCAMPIVVPKCVKGRCAAVPER